MLGQDVSYDKVPYFFSDQYDVGMEYAGLHDPGSDELVIRGDMGSREFIAFWLRGDKLVAGMNVNVWDVSDPIQALIASGASVDRARLTDADIPVEEVSSSPAAG
jgi:3-phenylpropionate/trans-cinnamate dioxygenase ferredoxin reductase subunit